MGQSKIERFQKCKFQWTIFWIHQLMNKYVFNTGYYMLFNEWFKLQWKIYSIKSRRNHCSVIDVIFLWFCLFVCIWTGAFSRFLPTLPYPFVGGDNSPPISTHSPPAAIAMTNIGNGNRIPLSTRDSRDPIDYMNTPTLVRPQPQLPSSAATIAAGSHLPNGTPSTLSPLRIRVSSPNRINSDLTSVSENKCFLNKSFSAQLPRNKQKSELNFCQCERFSVFWFCPHAEKKKHEFRSNKNIYKNQNVFVFYV